jgi:phage terminase small subunit
MADENGTVVDATEPAARPLPARQERFCLEYAVDRVAVAAYRRAGYRASTRNARTEAHRLLQRPAIAARVAALERERTRRTEIAADTVLRELADIAFARLVDFCSWGPGGLKIKPSAELTAAQQAGILEIRETKFGLTVRLGDKLGALTRLGEHLSLFVRRTQFEGLDGKPIEFTLNVFSDATAAPVETVGRG